MGLFDFESLENELMSIKKYNIDIARSLSNYFEDNVDSLNSDKYLRDLAQEVVSKFKIINGEIRLLIESLKTENFSQRKLIVEEKYKDLVNDIKVLQKKLIEYNFLDLEEFISHNIVFHLEENIETLNYIEDVLS